MTDFPRKICLYDSRGCTRKNRQHWKKFSHPISAMKHQNQQHAPIKQHSCTNPYRHRKSRYLPNKYQDYHCKKCQAVVPYCNDQDCRGPQCLFNH